MIPSVSLSLYISAPLPRGPLSEWLAVCVPKKSPVRNTLISPLTLAGSAFRLLCPSIEETKQVLRLSLTEFSLPKFYLLFGISKVKSAAVIAFRSSYRDRSFSPGSYERETFALSSLETVTEALLEIMEVGSLLKRRAEIGFRRTFWNTVAFK